MSFRDSLESGKFLVTIDTIPPKGTDLSGVFRRLVPMKGRADGVNVVDMPSGVMRLSALPLCHLLKENGFEPILQITCRDRNRLCLQADLLGASVLGVDNILVLGGDSIALSDDPSAKAVFDLDSVELLRAARELEKGRDMAGNALRGTPRFCLGAVVDPAAEPMEAEIERMERKVSAGAEFFQTQPVYDEELCAGFMKKVSHLHTPILAGILLLKSARMALYMNETIPGVNVPKRIIDELDKAKDLLEKSMEIALRTIRVVRDCSQGVHIMTVHWEDRIPLILDALEM